MKKLIFISAFLLSVIILTAQSNYTYKVNGTVTISGSGIELPLCYVKSEGTPSMAADSMIQFENFAFSDRYQSIIYFLEKEGVYKEDSIAPVTPTEGYIRFIIKSEIEPQGIWTNHAGQFACYTNSAWKYYNKKQEPFRIDNLIMAGQMTSCYKLDATCYRNTMLADIKSQLYISDVTILADPSGNSRE